MINNNILLDMNNRMIKIGAMNITDPNYPSPLVPGKLYQVMSEYNLRSMMRSKDILKHSIKGHGMNPFHHTNNSLFKTNESLIMFLEYQPPYDNRHYTSYFNDIKQNNSYEFYDHPGEYKFLIKQHTVSFVILSTYSIALRSILNPILNSDSTPLNFPQQ